MAKVIVGMFDNMERARDAVSELTRSGFSRDAISLVAGDERGEYRRYVGDDAVTADDVTSAAAGGAGVGAVLGAIGGLLVGLGALAIPGIGPVIAAGPIASALASAGVGAVAGAAAGGLLGALVDMGVPEERARIYQEGIRAGNVLVTVQTSDDMASRAVDILNRFNPIDVDRKSTEWSTSGAAYEGSMGSGGQYRPTDTTSDSSRVGRMEPALGGVGFDSSHSDIDTGRTDRTDFGSHTDYDTTHPDSGTIGGPAMSTGSGYSAGGMGSTSDTSPFDRYDTDWRDHFHTHYGSGSYTYDDYRPYYQYGYQIHQDPRFRDRSWSDVEHDLRSDWERTNPDSPWEEFKDAVRRGWDALVGPSY